MRSDTIPAPEEGSDAYRLERLSDRGRDDTASERDIAAQIRDEHGAQRDRAADVADQRSFEVDARDALADRHTLRVQELRARAIEGRRRAAEDRARAAYDRKQAARDRERAAEDRRQARLDRDRAGTDELTGARRRGVGLEELEREIDRARRTGQPLVAAYVDVDGLKAVNDVQGHRAGDKLLRAVADGLRHHMRSYDLIVRLGGDEFLCVLPGVTVDEVMRRLAELKSELSAEPPFSSVTVGLSELRDADGPLELIDRADRNMLACRKQAELRLAPEADAPR